MDHVALIQDIERLSSQLANRETMYLLQYNWFIANNRRTESIRELYTTPPGYYNYYSAYNGSTGVLPAINVGMSIVLTLQSKLIQSKGRFYFTGVNGLWKTIKLIRNAQVFFDAFSDMDKTHKKTAMALLYAYIFGVGVIHTDGDAKCNEVIKPWEFFLDAAEYNFGKVSRAFTRQLQYPILAFKDRIKKDKHLSLWSKLEADPFAKCTYISYYNLIEKKRYILVDGVLIEEKPITFDKMPFSLIYYQDPIKGFYSTSVLDVLWPIQRQIDDILVRIHEALALNPANTIFIPYEGDPASADRMAKILSDRIANVFRYKASPSLPNGGKPEVSTPNPINGQYQTYLQYFIDKAYEIIGISALSAQSKKPTGINSGVALDTLQDVESERFQQQVDQFIQFYKDIYNNMIDVFPDNDEILPAKINRANVKWRDIKRERDSFTIQTSLASVLSKDPKVKMEQMEKLVSQGVIDPNSVASLLEIPDIDRAYSTATASYDYCLKVIESAIDEDQYYFYPVLNITQCLSVAVNILCQLAAEGEDDAIIQRLVKLINILMGKVNDTNQINNPPVDNGPPPDLQQTALNGPQMAALMQIASGVASGQYTSDMAMAALQIAMPMADPAALSALVGLPPAQEVPPDVAAPQL